MSVSRRELMAGATVPPHRTHDLKLVSRSWRDLLDDSSKVRKSRQIQPREEGEFWDHDYLEDLKNTTPARAFELTSE